MRRLVVLLALLLLPACSEPAAEAPQPPVVPDTAGDPPAGRLHEVPAERTDAFAEPIRAQLVAARRDLANATTADQTAAADGQLGMLHHAYDLLPTAALHYENAQALSPKDVAWPYLLGDVRREQGRADEAIAAYKRALDLLHADPTRSASQIVAGFWWIADSHLAAGRPAQARPYLESALRRAPGHLPTVAALGRVAAASDRPREALELFERLAVALPEDPAVSFLIAAQHRRLGNDAAAELSLARARRPGADPGRRLVPADPLLQRVAALLPQQAERRERARRAFRQGRYEEAHATLLEALAVDERSAGVRRDLGATLARLGRIEEARTELVAALELDTERIGARALLGVVEDLLGHATAAETAFRAVLEVDARHALALVGLARQLERRGDLDAAAECYAKTPATGAVSVNARLGLARVRAAQSRPRDALAELEAAVALSAGNARATGALARLLVSCDDESLRDVKRGCRLAIAAWTASPTLDNAETLARAYAATGAPQKAADVITVALVRAERADVTDRARLDQLREALRGYRRAAER